KLIRCPLDFERGLEPGNRSTAEAMPPLRARLRQCRGPILLDLRDHPPPPRLTATAISPARLLGQPPPIPPAQTLSDTFGQLEIGLAQILLLRSHQIHFLTSSGSIMCSGSTR